MTAPLPAAPIPDSSQASTVDGGPADRSAQDQVEQMLGRVARARQLQPRAQVRGQSLDRTALVQRVRDHVDREIPTEVLRSQGEVLVAFGVLAPDFDYEANVYQLLESQLAGFYDPHDKSMYLASDLTDQASAATLAHELVHALQDQHYELGPRLSFRPGEADVQAALQALAEGDATSAMMDTLLEGSGRHATDLPDDEFARQVISAMGQSSQSPRILRSALAAPYVDGLLFVHRLRRQGDWGAVDRAWRAPPVSTEQLLHAEKYDAREQPDALPPLPLPRTAPPLSANGKGRRESSEAWAPLYDDAMGEQGLRILFEEWGSAQEAALAASGWGGDRFVISTDRESGLLAIAWHLRFDRAPTGDPNAFAKRAFRMLAQGFGNTSRSPQTTMCLKRTALPPVALMARGRDLVVTVAPYRHSGQVLQVTENCAQPLRWANEVLSGRSTNL